MWLLKGIAKAISGLFEAMGAMIMLAFIFAFMFGFVTIGCSQSLWTNKMACTLTLIFNSFK